MSRTTDTTSNARATRVRRTGPALAGALLALGLAGCGSSAADEDTDLDTAAAAETDQSGTDESAEDLVFAAVPSEESTSLEAEYEAILAMLAEETGREVTFQQATDYAAVIEGQRAGKIDIAQFGPFSYVIAVAQGAEVVPVAAGVDAEGAEPGYQSLGIVPAGSDIEDLAGYAGKKVCFVDPASTSGFLFPSAGLLEADVDPEADVEGTFAGGHDASALAVADGQCEAGFVQDVTLEKLIDTGSLAEEDVQVIWESETIPGSPIAIRDGLPDDLVDTLTAALQEKANVSYLSAEGYCESEEKCQVGEGGWGFAAVDDGFYDGVRAVCESTEAETCEGV